MNVAHEDETYKRRETKDDGRYIIFYSFSDELEIDGAGGEESS
jgi:hypothetical protein